MIHGENIGATGTMCTVLALATCNVVPTVTGPSPPGKPIVSTLITLILAPGGTLTSPHGATVSNGSKASTEE